MVRTKPQSGMGQVYLDANTEALRRGDRKVSTEHVLLALLTDPGSATARALGVSLDAAREALENLDRDALASAGVHAASAGPVFPGRERDRLPLTPAAKAVFTGLGEQAGRERIGLQHVLLGLLSRRRPDPAAVLLDALGVDRTAVRARLGRG
ncbi:Clp protease N-terminal domain-containing protein [Marinactinospora thermotolerans]|uniref:Clp amino terminal domain-containing protein, pathogenicity island component n=1 Tax=Marinactinospora thermotolerans DSM 45154 TaxID=1122192 RepID=A0A1T4PKR8_9ACTN|nr:Clp protease N-terminal domain-containing protein [Marinactinospora thermotolerans]SJZ92155.1 Clp amino terminal domain-containing protein, pathogenicity island component [Marinactinospora thermotolerans DSM 45154]